MLLSKSIKCFIKSKNFRPKLEVTFCYSLLISCIGGEIKGFTGKKIMNVICIGIGGSYLGIEFVYEALRNHKEGCENAKGRKLRFLANVDPIDFARAIDGLDLEETLVLINSKTFTTAETMLNARTMKNLFLFKLSQLMDIGEKDKKAIIDAHFGACSTAKELTTAFGINEAKRFEFWDWVGGRYSVCSCIGMLPLSIQFGFEYMEKFLQGAHSIDVQFLKSPNITENIPLMLGMIGFYLISVQSNEKKENYNIR